MTRKPKPVPEPYPVIEREGEIVRWRPEPVRRPLKKSDDCEHLYRLRLNEAKRTYRCCRKRVGVLLKTWRCVGKDNPDCPKNTERKAKGQ